jgi:uncharacterized protein YceK
MKKTLITLAICVSITGCASVSMAPPEQDAAAKTFSAPKKNAGLYIYRNESMGGSVKMTVSVDGQAIGQTTAKTYLYKEITPGKHTIISQAENDSTLDIDVKAGTLYYVWQEVKMGLLYARNELHLVDDHKGKIGVSETKLANTK